MQKDHPLLKTSNLMVGYKQGSREGCAVAGPLDLEMKAGQLICLLGPNGAGKSTLLRTLAGLQAPLGGEIELSGQHLSTLKPPQIARRLSLVLTESVRSGNLDVYSLISLGRYPYSGWLGKLTEDDRAIIDDAIQATHVGRFVGRKIGQLSDGECQKVMLARALAQDTPLIVLDEPTAHLDLPSRIELMRLLHKLARDTNKGILISTHELDLALQVADKVWLIRKDGKLEAGSPETLVLNGTFEAAFDTAGIVFDKSTGSFNLHEHKGKTVNITGEGAVSFWTKRALIRQGFSVVDAKEARHTISIEIRDNVNKWIIRQGDTATIEVNSIDELLSRLKLMN